MLGLLIGSFLNVVIVRLPRMMTRDWAAQCKAWQEAEAVQALEKVEALPTTERTVPAVPEAPEPPPERFDLAWPPSHCPQCSHRLRWHENLPVIGWLRLKGRCAHCANAIPWHYPAVEALTALLFAICAWQYGPSVAAVAAMGLCAALVALAFIDAQTSLLPDDITLPLLWAGLLLNISGMFAPLADAVLGAALGYGVLWVIFQAFRLATDKEGMGFGDFKLLAALGAWLGWRALPEILLFSSVAGVLVGGALLITGRAQRGDPLPFGPYLAMAGLACLLLRQNGVGLLGF
ncbi:A24 family peptidase [Pigmentiphaga aceris]|uniref:prepilin peptidase n=1 Tax=Pigmentiphaga aceris TaxID=1940612 RepID=UPI00319DEB99